MKEDIKIPIIVKISFGLVITEVVLAISWFLFAVIYNYGECKWGILAVFGIITILLHILLAWCAYCAVIKRKKKDSMAIGIVLLALTLIFLRLIFTEARTTMAVIAFAVPVAFFCFNGIIFIYWARQIKPISNSRLTLEEKIKAIHK